MDKNNQEIFTGKTFQDLTKDIPDLLQVLEIQIQLAPIII